MSEDLTEEYDAHIELLLSSLYSNGTEDDIDNARCMIESLHRRNKELLEALKPFADAMFNKVYFTDDHIQKAYTVYYGETK